MYSQDDVKNITIPIGGTPNTDQLYEYNGIWNTATYTDIGGQSFTIGALGVAETITLMRIKIRGYIYRGDVAPPCDAITLKLYGNYPNGPNGFPWPVPPYANEWPQELASITKSTLPEKNGILLGDWVEFDLSPYNIIIPPNQKWSFFITAHNGLFINNTHTTNDVYPGGMHVSYTGDTNPYYSYDGKRDWAFQLYGVPTP